MRIIIKPSFERIYKKLPRTERIRVDEKIRELFNYHDRDMLFAGLMIRKIRAKIIISK